MMQKAWKKEAIADVVNLALGAWLVLTPWIFGFVPESSASWNVASPWLVGFSGHSTATGVHVLVGIAVAVVAAVRLWFMHRSPPRVTA